MDFTCSEECTRAISAGERGVRVPIGNGDDEQGVYRMEKFFGDEAVAVPIVDRLIHHSHIFMLGGESYRLREKLGR